MSYLSPMGIPIGRGAEGGGPNYPTGVPSAFSRIAAATVLAVSWEDAHNEEDARGGKVLNGFWFPAHAIVTVDGKEYGRPFAPNPRPEQ